MSRRTKKRSIPMVLFSILMILTLLLSATALGIWLYGRQALTTKVVAPKLPPAPVVTTEDGTAIPETPVEETDPDPSSIRYKDARYRYNENIVNILLMGIDADNKPAAPLPYGSDIQVDVVLLAALDLKNKDMTLLSINRDTMANIEIFDPSGESLGLSRTQLALSYAYGDGLKKSCELTIQAVSDLFYGLQIHGYGTFYMGGISELNDAVGGVTVTILGDYPFTHLGGDCAEMIAGSTLTLNGNQAYKYIRLRNDTETGNTDRMARQKQYLLSMLSQTMDTVRRNPRIVFSLYHALDDYILTDLDVTELSYLASQAASMSFDGEIHSLTGEMILSDEQHMELTLDPVMLYETILNVFYEKIE